jgi:hypothetical protein
VATHSTNVQASWGGVPFSEIIDLSWQYGGGMPKGRGVNWTDERGSLTLTCLGATNISTAEHGTAKLLSVSGGGADLTLYAIYESLSVAPELNGITRYTATFKFLDW